MAKGKIITLMFHRVHDKRTNFSPQQFGKYLAYLVQNFPIVVPGEVSSEKLSICLTFDDAYFDFYHHVYPLLKKYQIRALLAVPVKYILETTTLDNPTRLQAPLVMHADYNERVNTPYCTWQELQEMAKSREVIMASHGFAHEDLTQPRVDIVEEIAYSKQELQNRLQIPIRHFVYPYGRFSRSLHQKILEHYDYGLRIGSALNRGWDEKDRIIYRINADKFWPRVRPFKSWNIQQLTLKYWGNRLRRK